MSHVSGRVVLHGSGQGIAHLNAVLFRVDDEVTAKEVLRAGDLAGALAFLRGKGNRAGSDNTGASGTFNIPVDGGVSLTRADGARRDGNWLLAIAAPEGGEHGGKLLHATVLGNAGGDISERVVIRVDEELLTRLDLDPRHSSAVRSRVASSRLRAAERASASQGVAEAAAERVAQARGTVARRESLRERFRAEISTARAANIHGDLLVDGADEIRAATAKAVERGLRVGINNQPTRTRYHLTPEKLEALRTALDGGDTIEAKALRSLLTDGLLESVPQLLRHEELVTRCLRNTREDETVAHMLNGGAPVEDAPTGGNGRAGGAGVMGSIVDGIPTFVARLFDPVTSPESLLDGGDFPPSRRPSADDVATNIGALRIEPGPADQPAYFDFHELQIAFEPVWREHVGRFVIDLADRLSVRLLELGGDPEHDSHGDRPLLERFRLEAAAVEATLRDGSNPGVIYRMNLDEGTVHPNGDEDWLGGGGGPGGGGGFGGGGLGGGGGNTGGTETDDTDTPDPGATPVSPRSLLQQLEHALQQDYAFTVFGADAQARSVNFGLINTYRQKWEPIAYQAGELAKTVTLAPQESRDFKHRMVIKRRRNEKEITKSSSVRKEEMDTKSRAEADIVEKATAKTNFALSAKGSYNVGVAGGSATTTIGRDAARDSAETKKSLREAVIKSAQEYRQERTTEVQTEASFETEEIVSGQVKNPNDELAVTFLFYELQRRYRLHEELHRVTPVVLVAQEVPEPDGITEGWLVTHDWILKRALLDDTFRPALDYLSTNYEGDRLTIQHLKKEVQLHRDNVDQLRDSLIALQRSERHAYNVLRDAIQDHAEAVQGEGSEGLFRKAWDFVSGDKDPSPESARIAEDAARDALDRATVQLKQEAMKMQREVSALEAVSERYQKFLATHNNLKVQIERLKVHVRQNILYYMQAIWSYEPPDQRYFRLYQTPVPTFEDRGSAYRLIEVTDEEKVSSTVDGPVRGQAVDFELTPDLVARFDEGDLRPLVEVADLDELLGFKGNYMIFPLKESNPLTDTLMDPYVDAGFQDLLALIDPDETAMMSRSDFARFVECLHAELTEGEFSEIKPALNSMYKKILQAASRPGEEIIVPTGSLFIEALPATHPLLESFKLAHRAVDVKKAQADARAAELENLRIAARLLASGEHITLLEDPDIERKVVIEGQAGNLTIPSDDA